MRETIDALRFNTNRQELMIKKLCYHEPEDWEEEIPIGQGSFGKVFLKRYGGDVVAVKVPYDKFQDRGDDQVKRVCREKMSNAHITMEAIVHCVLQDHPSFPKLFGVVMNGQGSPSLAVEFVGDLMTGTSFPLCQALKFYSHSVSEDGWFDIILDIVRGMKALRDKGLLHNDLKANNILLKWDDEAKRWRGVIIDMSKVSTAIVPIKHRAMTKDEL
ncbi:serine/threonine-protein kinase 16-like [Diadema setosum]|uniref:serine/threonine-protein kinase 16-like n=1 Tax=Diadema setosum TaxID=31175 RepID=UPI003B3B9A97